MCVRNRNSPDADVRRDGGKEFPESKRQDSTDVVLPSDVRCVSDL